MSPLEWIAATLGVINVVLIIRQSLWNFPFGIAMVILYAWIFYDYRLYGDAGLQVVYVALQIYGWWFWASGRAANAPSRPITVLSGAGRFAWALVALLLWVAIAVSLQRWTDASLPWWDGAVTAFSLVAQALLMRKHLESWAAWITVDLLAIPLFFVKELYPTTILYALFLGLAITGGLVWLRDWRAQQTRAGAALAPMAP